MADDGRDPKGDESRFEVVLKEMGQQGFQHPLAKPAAVGAILGAIIGSGLLDGGGFLIGGICGGLCAIYLKMND